MSHYGDSEDVAGRYYAEGMPDEIRMPVRRESPSGRVIQYVRGDDLGSVTFGDMFRQVMAQQVKHQSENLRQRLVREVGELDEALTVLATKLARRRAQVKELDKYPDVDPFEDGAIIRFDKTFPGGEKAYRYVAYRTDGLWYVSGTRSPQGATWDALVDFMGLGVKEVWHVNASKRIRGGGLQQVERKVIG